LSAAPDSFATSLAHVEPSLSLTLEQ